MNWPPVGGEQLSRRGALADEFWGTGTSQKKTELLLVSTHLKQNMLVKLDPSSQKHRDEHPKMLGFHDLEKTMKKT